MVNSFDIFDTLIARECKNPKDIFFIMENILNLKNFANNRVKSEEISHNIYKINNNLDNIYSELQKILKVDDNEIEKIKLLELDIEYKNSIPIISNINKIKDGDIYLADMYLTSDQIINLLKKHNINVNNKLYVTSGGKADGSIYKYIINNYKLDLHTGDNYVSDIINAEKFNIKTKYTTISKFTDVENFLYDNKYYVFQKLIRKYRLQNPYDENTKEFTLYNQQITYNIPILIIFSQQIYNIITSENLDKVLFLSRDCCLLIKIFKKLYPNINCMYFYSSRIINIIGGSDYQKYIKENINNKSLIIDLNGSFNSGRELYKKCLGYYPRCHLLQYDMFKEPFNNLSYLIKNRDLDIFLRSNYSNIYNKIKNYYYSHYIEVLNYDLDGTLLFYVENINLNYYNENNEKYVNISHNLVENFIQDLEIKKIEKIDDYKNLFLNIYALLFVNSNEKDFAIFNRPHLINCEINKKIYNN